MGTTITVRLPDDLASWVEERARTLGISRAELVKEMLERGRSEHQQPEFMKLAGTLEGPRMLSSRKGFSHS